MKFTVSKAKMSAAIASAARVVERRNTIPVLSNVLLLADEDALKITATDLDVEISLTIEADVEVPGKITVSAILLSDIVKKLGSTEVKFSLSENSQQMEVSAWRSRFKLLCLPAGDFPDMASGTYSHAFHAGGAEILQIINRTQFAISTEETRFYLTGIYLSVAEVAGSNKLRAVATDGHRLALADMEAPDGAPGMPGIIVPRKTISIIHAVLAGEESLYFEISQNKIRITGSTIVLTSKLIDGTFPDYERVIPTSGNLVAIFDTEKVKSAVDRVKTISSERGRATKLTFEDNTLDLLVNNPDSGDAKDVVDIEYDGAPISIGFNAQYIMDVLSNIPGGKARLQMEDSGAPTIFKGADDDSALFVLMPMRV